MTTSKAAARPGNDALKDYRGSEPGPGETDERTTAPVDDDAGTARPGETDQDQPATQRKVAGVDADDTGNDAGADDAPTVPPSDDARNKIAKRFAEHRNDPVPEPDTPEPEAGDGDNDDPDNKARSGGPSDSGAGADDAPKDLVLAVNGKTYKKSIAEIAALSELSEDEVLADPKRAIRYAQLEAAKQENLREAKEMRRATPARQDDAARPARPDPNQDRSRKAENEDDPDQPDPSQDTTGDVDFVKLAETIQVEDPKVAGKLLAEAMDTVAERKLGKVRQDISQGETDRLVRDDLQSSTKATKQFLDAHADEGIAGNKFIASAMRTALYDEYRTDMVKALVAEGDSQEDAALVVSQATDAQIATAHQRRRIKGDPNVRPITAELMESAFTNVTKSLGVKTPQTQQRSLKDSRTERKQALPTQPRRASMPPATPPAPKQPLTRSSVVAQMKQGRGQAGHKPSA